MVNFVMSLYLTTKYAGALWPRTPIMLEGPRMLVAPLFHQASEFYMLITPGKLRECRQWLVKIGSTPVNGIGRPT